MTRNCNDCDQLSDCKTLYFWCPFQNFDEPCLIALTAEKKKRQQLELKTPEELFCKAGCWLTERAKEDIRKNKGLHAAIGCATCQEVW